MLVIVPGIFDEFKYKYKVSYSFRGIFVIKYHKRVDGITIIRFS